MSRSLKIASKMSLIVFISFCGFMFSLPQASGNEADFKSGVSLYKKKKYELAIEKLTKVVKANRGDYRACFFLGRCYEQLGNKNKAAKMYRDAIVYGYKTRVSVKAGQYLEHIDKTRYILAIGAAQKRYEARKAKELNRAKVGTKSGSKSQAKSKNK